MASGWWLVGCGQLKVVTEMADRNIEMARRVAEAVRQAGYVVLEYQRQDG